MAITTDTELIHEQLGSIRYDDGKHDPQVAGMRDTTPKWVCRPDGWDASGFEIYLPGTADAPLHLSQALAVLQHRSQIEQEGQALSSQELELAWVDLTTSIPTAAFINAEEVYILWKASLDKDWKIIHYAKGYW